MSLVPTDLLQLTHAALMIAFHVGLDAAYYVPLMIALILASM